MKYACLALFCLILFRPAAGAAEIKSEAGIMMKDAVQNVLLDLQSPHIKTPGPEQSALLRNMAETIRNCIDFEEFSARAVGSRWRSFTPEQKQNFTAVFSDWLYSIYLTNLLKYSGQAVEFTGETVSERDGKSEIRSAFMYEGKPVSINYRLLKKNGLWRVYDIHIESISIVKQYREEIQAALQKQTPDELIARIRIKADETMAATNASIGR
jgi:phospholipid transport system substrate-binding protein